MAVTRPVKLTMLAMLSGCLGWPSMLLAEPDLPDHLQVELGYRVGLFEYYQGDPLAALTALEVDKWRSQQRSLGEPIAQGSTATANARLLEAGIRLGYGLHRSARALLSQLVASPTLSEQGYAEATLYLAQWLYQHQQPEAALRVLADARGALPLAQGQQAAYLQQLLMAKVGHPPLTGVTDTDADAGPWQPYLLYNRAVVQLHSGESAQALTSLQQALTLLAQGRAVADDSWLDLLAWRYWFPPTPLPLADSEIHALTDQVQLARARIYRQQQDYSAALDAYRQVSLEGMAAPDALFSYGWTAFNAGQQPLSITAWQALAQRPDLNAELLQVHLAIAWSYEQWGMPGMALQAYQQGADAYRQVLAELEQQITTLQADQLIQHLLAQSDDRWLSEQEGVRISSLPRLDHLMVSQSMQSMLIDARDLRLLQANLQRWQGDIAQFDAMLEVRELARQAQLEALAVAPPEAEFMRLRDARDQLAAELAKSSTSPQLLATASEQAIVQRLQRAEQTLATLQQHPNYAEYAERLRRVRGVLAWQLTDDQIARQWQHSQSLKALDDQLRAAEQALARLHSIAAEPSQQRALQQRVSDAGMRLRAQLQTVDTTYAALRQQIFSQVQAELLRQQQQVKSHLAQSQLAITRLYEHYLKWQQEGAQPPAEAPASAEPAAALSAVQGGDA